MAPTVLFFFKDDMKNTQLFAADGKLLYTVHTDKRSDSKTTVTRGETHASDSEEINPASPAVATIAHHELLPDTIQFGDAHATKLRGWLHGAKGKWTDYPGSFVSDSQEYTWKTDDSQHIVLVSANDLQAPLAQYQPSTAAGAPHHLTALDARARLVLEPEAAAAPLMDAVVVSFLLVEHGLRLRNGRMAVGEGMGRLDGNNAFKQQV